MNLHINKILGYSIARFGPAGISFVEHQGIGIKEVDHWRKLTTEYFAMDADHEEIQVIHNDYKNYTATQMRKLIETLK